MMEILGALLGCSIFMIFLWLLARSLDNYSIVDIGWAFLFTPVVIYFFQQHENHFRHFYIVFIVFCWSMRLSSHLLFRIVREHPKEDGRYLKLRQAWAGNLQFKMFWFYQLQGISVVLLCIPFFISLRDPSPQMNTLHAAATLLWLVSMWGEAVADKQLRDFKKSTGSKGRTCRVGLWKYSRHPNYFFEWLIWVAYFLFALSSPWGWVGISSPLIMLYLLLRVTGIPATEEQSIKSRGEDYRQYQRSTSVFFSWFPRKTR